MKLYAAFTAAFLTASVSATGWRQQPPFPCPKNIANQCTDVEQVGFDWNDLGDDVPVTDYNGYKFEGWTCGSTPGKKSRSKGTQFGSKRIGCGLSKDEFTNTISCPSKEFSVGEFEVSTDVDRVDLEIHYIMPDNSVCKKSAKCYKDGETIPNDQCGGAKAVRIKIPKTSGVKKCNLFIHKIKFICGNKTTSVPVPTTTIAPPTPTPECGVSGKPDCTTENPTPTPTPTPECGVPGKPECPTCGVTGMPDCTTEAPTGTPTPTPTGTPTPTPECGVPGKPNCTSDTTTGTPTPTPDCGAPGKPECATCGVSGYPDCTTDVPTGTPTPTPKCGVPGKPDCTSNTTIGTPTPTPECGVPGKPECATCGVSGKADCTTDVPTGTPTPTPECGIPGKPECTTSTTNTPTTSPTTTDSATTTTTGPDCGVNGKPECTPVPTCGVDGKPKCGASTTDYPTTTDSPGTTTTIPGPHCGVDGKPQCSAPTTGFPTTTITTTTITTPGPSCGVEGKPECTTPITDHVTTTESPTTTTIPGPGCGVDGKPECSRTTTDYPTTNTPVAECGVEGKPDCGTTTTRKTTNTGTTTTILGEPTTSSTRLDCQKNPNAEGCTPTTTSPPVVTTYIPPPPPQSSCPDLVPKCLKTWIFKTSCTDTADAACFCPQPGFIEVVAGCIQAWGQTDKEIATGLSYLLGLCGDYISKNPTVVTCIPDTITLPPPVDPRTQIPVTRTPAPTHTIIVTNDVTRTITFTPTYTPYVPAPPPGITIIATVTKIEDCEPVTITKGPDAGKVVTVTTIVQERTITVPNVGLVVTKTEVQLVYPPQVSTIYVPGPTVYPVPKTTPGGVYSPTTLLTKAPTGFNDSQTTMPVKYDGAASSNKGPAALAVVIGGIVMIMMW